MPEFFMGFEGVPSELDELLEAYETAPATRPKKTLADFVAAHERGDTAHFYLDYFEEQDHEQLARRFGLKFLDGTAYRAAAKRRATGAQGRSDV